MVTPYIQEWIIDSATLRVLLFRYCSFFRKLDWHSWVRKNKYLV